MADLERGAVCVTGRPVRPPRLGCGARSAPAAEVCWGRPWRPAPAPWRSPVAGRGGRVRLPVSLLCGGDEGRRLNATGIAGAGHHPDTSGRPRAPSWRGRARADAGSSKRSSTYKAFLQQEPKILYQRSSQGYLLYRRSCVLSVLNPRPGL